MENEIAKLLLEEILEERELRKEILAKMELLDAYSRYRYGAGARGGIIMDEKRIVVTEKPNSYEFGKASNRFKVYFENTEDGKKAIETCKQLADHKNQLFGGEKDAE